MERYHMFKLGFAMLFYAAFCNRPMLVSGLRSTSLVTNQTLRPEDYAVFYQGVDGVPGVDFPVLSFIPRTTFSCDGIDSGYYADLDTDCQVFHICEEGKKISFLCPNGTIFEQEDLICEWWYKVNCTNAPNLYQGSAEFLREDIARRKFNRISHEGRERNHGAVMRIEESASVSAQQNGKPYRVTSTIRDNKVTGSRSNNLIQSAINKDLQNAPSKRYNDAETSNFVNNVNDIISTGDNVKASSASTSYGERQVYIRSTTPSSLRGGFTGNLAEAQSIKLSATNRGSVKFNGRFGGKTGSNIQDSGPRNYPGTVEPNLEEYNIEFPKHKSELASTSSSSSPLPKIPPVKIEVSKFNLGESKQESTVPLTRNDILNRRVESFESEELQVPQETAAFAPSPFNSVQGVRKLTTTNPHPNHRPTYSDLKRPDFSTIKYVNSINSVTPQYITTQSINNRRPFVGSRVGANISNKNSPRPQSTAEISSNTEPPVYKTELPLVSSTPHTFTYVEQDFTTTQPELFTSPLPLSDSSTKKPLDHATVYGSFSRGTPTTLRPSNGVEIKLGKNVDKISIQLSKSLSGGDTLKSTSTSGPPYLATDGYVRISGSISQPVVGRGSQDRPVSGPGGDEGTPSIVSKGNAVSTAATGQQIENLGIPFDVTPKPSISESSISNLQSNTGRPDLLETENAPRSLDNLATTNVPLYIDTSQRQEETTTFSSIGENNYNSIGGNSYGIVGRTSVPTFSIVGNVAQKARLLVVPNLQHQESVTSRYNAESGSATTIGSTDDTENLQGYTPISSVRPSDVINQNIRGSADVGVSNVYTGPSSRPQVSKVSTLSPDYLLKKNNDTDTSKNSFRQNFYPTKSKSYENIVTTRRPFASVGSTIQDHVFQTTPASTIDTLNALGSSTTQVSVSSTAQPLDVSFSPNEIGSTLSPFEDSSRYGSSTTQNDNGLIKLQSIATTATPIGDGVTGTGFYVTRNSLRDSTTQSVFGFSKATTDGTGDPTLNVNVSPNSGIENAIRTQDVTLSTTLLKSTDIVDSSLIKSETKFPRPFQKTSNSIYDDSSSTKLESVTPTYVTYKISSARPFELPKEKATPAPTIPTPFTTARSVQENIDNMINALQGIVSDQDYSSETPRPGLVIPPSAGPQTLHTLAQYFGNALDGIAAEREKETGEELDKESKEKLTSLLTNITMYRYKQLFEDLEEKEEEDSSEVSTTPRDKLLADNSDNLVETPMLRELAKNFSLALSLYLNNPDDFRKELESYRPTEPSPINLSTLVDENTEPGLIDEELLNFSDADSKVPQLPPLLSTPQAPSPTWGYIIAPKTNQDLDVKNSLNPDLHTADTQSFIPSFNNLATGPGKDSKDVSDKDAAGEHWTSSPGVTKLWQSALSVNPAAVNENLSTRPISITTEVYVADTTPTPIELPHSEIQYDLRSLPSLSLNTTHVHGILIDFVNTTKTEESNRLQRLLKKLNTTEDEFIHRMKEIESNPLTKRLILLLISECGANVTKDLEADPIHGLSEVLASSSSTSEVTSHDVGKTANSDIPTLVDPELKEDDQDVRALQLLNSLYSIASKFGK